MSNCKILKMNKILGLQIGSIFIDYFFPCTFCYLHSIFVCVLKLYQLTAHQVLWPSFLQLVKNLSPVSGPTDLDWTSQTQHHNFICGSKLFLTHKILISITTTPQILFSRWIRDVQSKSVGPLTGDSSLTKCLKVFNYTILRQVYSLEILDNTNNFSLGNSSCYPKKLRLDY